MERSLVLIKPDAMRRRLAGTILSRFEEKGLKIVALKMVPPDRVLAQRHYAIHADKPFFNDLINYITSSPLIAVVLAGESAVETARHIMGATNSAKAEPGTIRRDFGLDIQQNAVHGSDSVETAEKEIKLFFREDEIFDY